jgi:XTP/dITP diphosphohydrolase
VAATRNPHKLAELRQILRVAGLELVGLENMPHIAEVEEDGETFEANARKKAETVARAAGLWAMADDSGLEVQALGGAPGVRSARFAGEPPSHAANNAKLLTALEGQTDRRARFCCVIALSNPCGESVAVQGECRGRIASAPRGTGGFGYDPLFMPDGYDLTFAEMAPENKNRISHRARALETAATAWGHLFAGA